MSDKIGKLIAARLKALGKRQAWLAEEAGVSVNAVSKWTKTGKIARENVPRVAQVLEVSADELINGDAKPSARHAEAGSKLERLDPDETLLIELYRESGVGERKLIIGHAKLLAGSKAQTHELFRGRNKT